MIDILYFLIGYSGIVLLAVSILINWEKYFG